MGSLDRAEERISRLKGISIETSKNEKQSEKDWKKKKTENNPEQNTWEPWVNNEKV